MNGGSLGFPAKQTGEHEPDSDEAQHPDDADEELLLAVPFERAEPTQGEEPERGDTQDGEAGSEGKEEQFVHVGSLLAARGLALFEFRPAVGSRSMMEKVIGCPLRLTALLSPLRIPPPGA